MNRFDTQNIKISGHEMAEYFLEDSNCQFALFAQMDSLSLNLSSICVSLSLLTNPNAANLFSNART